MDYVIEVMPFILSGLKTTMWVFGVTALFSIPFGLIVCLFRLSKIKVVSTITQAYILIMRGTPLLLQIIFIFFGLPLVGIVLNREVATVIAFVLNYTAYFAEIFRGGVNSIDVGQFEASQVLKLPKRTTYLGIIFPQVFKNVFPSVSNELITLVKDTSLVYALGLGDILRAARTLSNKDASIIPLFLAGVVYLIIIGILTYILKKMEEKFEYYR